MIIQFHFLLFYTMAICCPPSMQCTLALIQIKLLNHCAASPSSPRKLFALMKWVRAMCQASGIRAVFLLLPMEEKHAVYIYLLCIFYPVKYEAAAVYNWLKPHVSFMMLLAGVVFLLHTQKTHTRLEIIIFLPALDELLIFTLLKLKTFLI